MCSLMSISQKLVEELLTHIFPLSVQSMWLLICVLGASFFLLTIRGDTLRLRFVAGGRETEQAQSGLDDARNLGVVELETSTPRTPFTLKAAIWKLVNYGVCKWRRERHDSLASEVYSSPRIDQMIQTRSTFSTDLEFEIESSKVHWSEVAPVSDDSELESLDPQAFIGQGIFSGDKYERLAVDVKYVCDVSVDSQSRENNLMAMLFLRWPMRFPDKGRGTFEWRVGRKIAEGAQAEIFEATGGVENRYVHGRYITSKYVYKVFREGYRVRDLQRLWPKQLGTGYSTLYTCPIRRGILLDNGRFASLMPRYWGDLRKFLDKRMQVRLDHTHPPCSDWEATRSMLYIAKGMRDLHISNIVHRDLKASNVLVEMIERSDSEKKKLQNKEFDTFYCRVADFESSKGVLGTSFWRAPEILLVVKHRTSPTSDLFTKASDVYSYAMTCYEIWTGRLPFEDLKGNEYVDIVIEGGRPRLPPQLEPWIQEMVERCWHADPCKRPTFQDICDTIANYTDQHDQQSVAPITEPESSKDNVPSTDASSSN